MEENNKEKIDLLESIQGLTGKLGELGEKGKDVFSRYPMTFTILIIFATTMVTQGIRDILMQIEFFQGKPIIMVGVGLFILAVTGTLYKTLGK